MSLSGRTLGIVGARGERVARRLHGPYWETVTEDDLHREVREIRFFPRPTPTVPGPSSESGRERAVRRLRGPYWQAVTEAELAREDRERQVAPVRHSDLGKVLRGAAWGGVVLAWALLHHQVPYSTYIGPIGVWLYGVLRLARRYRRNGFARRG